MTLEESGERNGSSRAPKGGMPNVPKRGAGEVFPVFVNDPSFMSVV